MAPRVAAMDTWRLDASVSIGLAVPGPPIRSLVAGGTGNAVRRPRPDGTADPEQESANLSCAMIPH